MNQSTDELNRQLHETIQKYQRPEEEHVISLITLIIDRMNRKAAQELVLAGAKRLYLQ